MDGSTDHNAAPPRAVAPAIPIDVEYMQSSEQEAPRVSTNSRPQHSPAVEQCRAGPPPSEGGILGPAVMTRKRKSSRRRSSSVVRGRLLRTHLGGTMAATLACCSRGAGGLQMSATMTSPAAASSPPKSSLSVSGRDTGGGIGDMARSQTSSSRFFRMIDRDGDGILERPEMATFVANSIGGSAFDTPGEVEAGVKQAMERLDRDDDDGLDRSDVFAYWMQLESLLTADEVAEWIVYATQLPESVGEIFKANVVTGYDFPELVDNDGAALLSELGIEKESFRKKILRHINARMLGIGTVPTIPTDVRHNLESCSTVSLSWTRSTAKGFPVHSYRIQRRAVALHSSSSSSGSASSSSADAHIANNSKAAAAGDERDARALVCDAPAFGSHIAIPPFDGDDYGRSLLCDASAAAAPPQPTASSRDESAIPPTAPPTFSASDWLTMYCGGENEFVDATLKKGHNYVYRIQAWNSVGRSEWATLDISRSLKKQRCTTVTTDDPSSRSRSSLDGVFFSSANRGDGSYSQTKALINGMYFVFNFIITFVRAIFALAAIGAAVMRFKRANATSTTAACVDPVFPWLWKGINALSVRVTGVEVIPKSMLGDRQTQQYESTVHDKYIKAVGLNGYKKGIANAANGASAQTDDVRPNRRVMFSRSKSYTTGNLAGTLDRMPGGLSRSEKANVSAPEAIQENDTEDGPPTNVDCHAESTLGSMPPSSRRRFFRSKSTESSQEAPICGPCDPSINGTSRSLPPQVSMRTLLTNDSTVTFDDDYGSLSGSSRRQQFDDDHTRCNTCHKRYKFPKRFRHHCARCLSAFCHKHGRTTHSNLVSCRVPGDCVCSVCLELEAFNSTQRSESSEK